MACSLCVERGNPAHYVSGPKCAFNDDGSFNPDNWSCATMNALRRIANAHKMYLRDDDIGTISVAPFEGDEAHGFIVMCYYKDRGRVPTAFVCGDEVDPRPLTLGDAQSCMEYSKNKAVQS